MDSTCFYKIPEACT